MAIEQLSIYHLVKSEDLNHHRTLFAGRGAEWLVEAGFIAAASLLPPEFILCVKIHGMEFRRPVRPGEIVRFTSSIVLTGRSRLIAYVLADVKGEQAVDGFITFVYVDEQGKPRPHGIVIEASTPEEAALQERAKNL
ncbi:MAG: acyl-CoA thioesterase [Chloroflexi bacterium]|jgi:acyl-CoA hydrolase|nr:acyl-CoA thioesterase [Anaerolineaceae bacterium]NLI44420.1 acyl-CoA thioesterase [Chloroflexota bacterium]HOE34457.1 acyl-CoA thioesterase [Anaerolineaceae bacterium]HOT25467.1 acyl-CoA thioesterase [Anaerolineaceae bacterium]HQH57453.1 acyl-CoA thioesterase [Anaerolineaceae bacterium]